MANCLVPNRNLPAGDQYRNRAVSGEFFIQNEGGWGLSDARQTEARRSLNQNEGFGQLAGWVEATENNGGVVAGHGLEAGG